MKSMFSRCLFVFHFSYFYLCLFLLYLCRRLRNSGPIFFFHGIYPAIWTPVLVSPSGETIVVREDTGMRVFVHAFFRCGSRVNAAALFCQSMSTATSSRSSLLPITKPVG